MFNSLISKALEFKAEDTLIISPKTIITAEWVRLKCQYGCPKYSKCLTCPPYSPHPEQTKSMLLGYDKALLIHSKECKVIQNVVRNIEEEAFKAGFYKAFAMGAGPCELCEECDVNKPCVHPYLARPSMEACGIDVYASVRNNGFFIETVSENQRKVNYFGLVLIE
ncbi:MAG: DUF2284 domain-containing protein [bacterium]|nr:DUF2284 domain-containing protein [bacterium]